MSSDCHRSQSLLATVYAHDVVPLEVYPTTWAARGLSSLASQSRQVLDPRGSHSAKMARMSEPTTPDSAPENEPDLGLDPAPAEVSDPPAPTRGRQLIFIAAALVVALGLGGALFLIFRGDDATKPLSDEDQAKAAAVALLEGTYKSARGDASGCRQMTDNLILDSGQTDFFDRCVEQTESLGEENQSLVVDSVEATEVTLNDDGETGTVKVDVTATVDGTTETKNAPVPVRKVEGRWKVDPQG